MTTRFLTLSLTTVAEPASSDGAYPAQRHLAALALLIVEQAEFGWTIRLRSAAIGAGDGERRLLAWAADQLPSDGLVIGWGLAEDVVAPLLDAALDVDPDIGARFLDRVTPLVTGPWVDLAYGNAAASDGAAAVADMPSGALTTAEIESAWAFGDTGRLRQHAGAHAIAAWRLWLAGAPSQAFPAKEVFTRWLAGDADDAGSEEDR